MANVLLRAVKVLSNALQRVASFSVDIRRGGSAYACGVKGMLTSREYQVFDSDLMPWKKTVSDWILPQCKIDRDIEAGDEIVVNASDSWGTPLHGRKFVVLPIGNRPCVEPHDDLGVMIIVHTEEQCS